MNIIDKFLNEGAEVLEEGKAKSKMVRVTKLQQVNRETGRTAIRMAKEKNDPMYAKYHRLNAKRISLKKKLIKKYVIKAKKQARHNLL